jgi:glycosyltransferase involved in cell wall biosynthesis
MYHTTKDLVEAQRAVGIDCALIDAMDPTPKTDGTFSSEGYQWADTADVYAMHLAVPEPYMNDGTPTVMFLHGHPLYSMQVELYGLEEGNGRPFTTICNYFRRTQPTRFVSFWREDQGAFWETLDAGRDRVRYVPRGIMFGDQWVPEGPQRELEGDPCIVIADQFRVFKDLLPCLYGAFLYWQRNPKARLYLYGLPPVKSRERDCLDRWLLSTGLHGAVAGMEEIVSYLPEVFRRADVLVSNVTCESRVVVEAAACGCKVVAPWENACAYVDKPWRPDHFAEAIAQAVALDTDRATIAAQTRARYDMRVAAEALKSVYEELLTCG